MLMLEHCVPTWPDPCHVPRLLVLGEGLSSFDGPGWREGARGAARWSKGVDSPSQTCVNPGGSQGRGRGGLHSTASNLGLGCQDPQVCQVWALTEGRCSQVPRGQV